MSDFTPPRPKVLYVDDQVGNLTVFRASMRRHADITTATSGAEALQILERETFSVVISDQRMEGMQGTELLIEVRKRYPDTVRILLTAYSDFNAAIEAINEGRISRFVRKPWNREEMCNILTDASRLFHMQRRNRALAESWTSRQPLADFGEYAAARTPHLARCADVLTQYGRGEFGKRATEARQVQQAIAGVGEISEGLVAAVTELEASPVAAR